MLALSQELFIISHCPDGGDTNWSGGPNWPKWLHGQSVNWGEVAGGQQPQLRDCLGISQGVLSNCTVQCLFVCFFIIIIFSSLSYETVFILTHNFYSVSLPHPTGRSQEWLWGVSLPAQLNHSTWWVETDLRGLKKK